MENARRRIIILGGGFAGVYCAQELERAAKRMDLEVILISRHDYLLFYPLLIEAGTGSAEARHAVVSIRAFLKKTNFRMGEVLSVNAEKRQVTYRRGREGDIETLSCDHLVFAWGSVTRLPDVPGLIEHGLQMKSLTDAVVLRDRAIELLETADGMENIDRRRALLNFVVVGGNFTGAEVAGELNSFLHRMKNRYPRIANEDIRVTLINRSERILKELDQDLANYAKGNMMRHGITFRFGLTVKEIQRDKAILTNGETLHTHTVIWCAGIAPNPLIRETSLPVDSRGYIICDRDMRVKGFKDVWAIGDCAINVDSKGNVYPFTAQHAVREGAHLARNLVRVMNGQEPEPSDIKQIGALAMIGHHTGVAKIFNLKFSGTLAWFLYRTVYLFKMPGFFRKLRIAADWTLDIFLPRDMVQLGVRQQPESRSDSRVQRGEVIAEVRRSR